MVDEELHLQHLGWVDVVERDGVVAQTIQALGTDRHEHSDTRPRDGP